MPERVSFPTRDGVTIVGDWQPVPSLQGATILLHMMPETRQSWASMQRALAKKNIASVAIDLRGHGESTQMEDGQIMDFRQFPDTEHQNYILDATAAMDWLRGKGMTLDRIYVVGASIGANAALALLADEPKLAGAVVFSPRMDYRGIDLSVDIGNILPHQSVLCIAAEDDPEPFADTKQMFEEVASEDKVFLPYKVAGHGTAILNADSSLADKIATWVSGQLNKV